MKKAVIIAYVLLNICCLTMGENLSRENSGQAERIIITNNLIVYSNHIIDNLNILSNACKRIYNFDAAVFYTKDSIINVKILIVYYNGKNIIGYRIYTDDRIPVITSIGNLYCNWVSIDTNLSIDACELYSNYMIRTSIGTFKVKGELEFYSNGNISSCDLYKPENMFLNNIRFNKIKEMFFYTNGGFQGVYIANSKRIKHNKNAYFGDIILFYPSGQLFGVYNRKYGYAYGRTISGMHLRSHEYFKLIKDIFISRIIYPGYRARTTVGNLLIADGISFYENGNIKKCDIRYKQRIKFQDRVIRVFDYITFYNDGKLHRIAPCDDIIINGQEISAYSAVEFDTNGAIIGINNYSGYYDD